MNISPLQVCQCFVFCALLEFALVNYASRSDMQRDRARERMERARRQWELEHADLEQQQQQANGGSTAAGATGGAAAAAGGGSAAAAAGMNHISSDAVDGIPGFALVRKFLC